jgi:ABC-type transporter Mla subunit MlaD
MHDAERILEVLATIDGKLDILMSAQSDVDAAVAELNTFLANLASQITAIQSALAAGGGVPVNTAALNSVIGQVPALQSALDALTAPAATPPPTS